MTRVLLTGASGFVGRHVLDALRMHTVEIVAVTRNAASMSDIDPAVRIVEMDIARPGANVFQRLGCPDVLIHLAWGGLPNYKSLHHFETELPSQYRFIKTLVEAGLSSMLVTGTCFEYGMQSGELSESILSQPCTPYAYAKNALLQQLQYLRKYQPFNLIWARLFYMYGEGQAINSLYPKLKETVLSGDKVFNMSGGEQLRDYLPVTEIAHRIVQLAISQCNIGTINICSGKPVSVRNLVERWIQDNNWEIELNLGYYPYPDYEPMEFWGSQNKFVNFMISSVQFGETTE